MKKITLAITILIMAFAFLPAGASAQTLKVTGDAAGGYITEDPMAGASIPKGLAKGAGTVEMLPPGITQLASTNALLGVRGSYENMPVDSVLTRINAIRKEAYDEGLASTYVPIKWNDALEYIAQIRSVEASVLEDHLRPKGNYMFNMTVNDVNSYAENLAWGGNALAAVEMWYSEKEDLVKNTGQETGHYKSLIDPSYTYIGLGSFQRTGGKWNCVSAEFTSGSGLDENQTNIYGDCIQLIEIPKSKITLSLSGADVAVGASETFTAKAVYNNCSLVLPETVWSSSKEAVATVSNGVVTGVAPGTATITAELAYYNINSGLTATKQVNVTGDSSGGTDPEGTNPEGTNPEGTNPETTNPGGTDPSGTGTELTKPASTKLVKLTKGKKCFTAKWKASGLATGYQIQYSLKKNMKGAKTIKVGKVTSKKIKGLKAKKTYYVRVRVVNDAGASAWSAVGKVKTK